MDIIFIHSFPLENILAIILTKVAKTNEIFYHMHNNYMHIRNEMTTMLSKHAFLGNLHDQ